MFGPLDFKISELRKNVGSMKTWCDEFVTKYSDCANSDDIQMCKEATQKLKELTEIFNRYPDVPGSDSQVK